MVNVGQRLGVEYRLSTGVKSISIDQATGKANGVVLENGTHLPSDIVISNADLVYTYNNLLPKTSYADSLSKRETSCSSISFYWSASKIIPELKGHNIFLADEYQESNDSIFKEHLIPTHPLFTSMSLRALILRLLLRVRMRLLYWCLWVISSPTPLAHIVVLPSLEVPISLAVVARIGRR